eukprot:TRINITY_DN4981_c0_g1_i2.p1 TRINITY_DN4981_c0_g1~~TRINITY_DN4981_c0_g1_i2.p1  ORF type:complete len:224 (+),score=40.39 TRINITY_DN4981_c0_g1_i2:530-1201(+)
MYYLDDEEFDRKYKESMIQRRRQCDIEYDLKDDSESELFRDACKKTAIELDDEPLVSEKVQLPVCLRHYPSGAAYRLTMGIVNTVENNVIDVRTITGTNISFDVKYLIHNAPTFPGSAGGALLSGIRFVGLHQVLLRDNTRRALWTGSIKKYLDMVGVQARKEVASKQWGSFEYHGTFQRGVPSGRQQRDILLTNAESKDANDCTMYAFLDGFWTMANRLLGK